MDLGRRLGLTVVAVAASVGLDQATKREAITHLQGRPMKVYLGDLFRFQFAENRGAFLSLGDSLDERTRFWILTFAVGLLLLGLLVYTTTNRTLTTMPLIAYGLIVGGGLSNWVDRATQQGAVVDFMNLGIGSRIRTGIFNVADLAIVAGIVLLVFFSRAEPKPALTT